MGGANDPYKGRPRPNVDAAAERERLIAQGVIRPRVVDVTPKHDDVIAEELDRVLGAEQLDVAPSPTHDSATDGANGGE